MRRETAKYLVQTSDVINLPENDGFVDVYVHMKGGKSYIATFYTLAGIANQMELAKTTGEFCSGLYFVDHSMVIVERLEDACIMNAIEDIVSTGRLSKVFDESVK
ncbi:MAG: hypothetical protein U0573_08665 [Phycisphaerales bacterium]|nr:hypothetical protein [Planctomycetota bacterium]